MTELSDLRKVWEHTGSTGDEADYLLMRVSLEKLPQEQLRLAAYIGHEAASLALERPKDTRRFTSWAVGLNVWGKEAVVRALYVLCHQACLQFLADDGGEELHPLPPILQGAKDWLVNQGADVELRVKDLGKRLMKSIRDDGTTSGSVLAALACFASVIGGTHPNENTIQAFLHVQTAFLRGSVPPDMMHPCDVTALIEESSRKLIRLSLAPWALGYSDPLLANADSS